MTKAKHYRREAPPPRGLTHTCVQCYRLTICRARIHNRLHLMCEMHGAADYVNAARANGLEGQALLDFENNICILPEFRFGYEAGLFRESCAEPQTEAYRIGFRLGTWVVQTTGGR